MAGQRVSQRMSIVARAPLSILRALRQPAWWVLGWTQRHTLSLWARSIIAEVRGPRPTDIGRLLILVTSLYKVTFDARLTNAAGLRSLALVGDEVVAETDEHWPLREVLASVLGGVEHVNGVRFETVATAPNVSPAAEASR